jgi:hypothetical protein
MGENSSVGIETGYKLAVGVRFQTGEIFSLLHSVQTGSKGDLSSYPKGTGSSFPEG